MSADLQAVLRHGPQRGLRRELQHGLQRHRAPLTAAAAFGLLLALQAALGGGRFGAAEFAAIAAGGTTLALAAIGQTLVVLAGGFDLSAGAVVSLVNVVLASPALQGWPAPALLALGVALGLAAGAGNGVLVALLRLPPIVATLSTLFMLQGLTLLIMDKPGGSVAPALAQLLAGEALAGLLPRPLLLLALVLAAWAWFKHTRHGLALYALGSDAASAHAAGVPTRRTGLLVYTLAGGCYGLAGVFVSAQTGSADPLIGAPLLLQVFAAVVVGGTVLGGGRGGPAGSVFGAFVLMLVVDALLVLEVSAYGATIAEGAILLLAVLAGALGREQPLARHGRRLRSGWQARRLGQQVHPLAAADRIRLPDAAPPALPPPSLQAAPAAPWHRRHAETLRFVLPAWAGLAAVLLATQALLGRSLGSLDYLNAVLVLSSVLVVLALGQGAVILSGGLDLSLPWTLALCAIVLASLLQGRDASLWFALPLVLALGALVGCLNGLGIVLLGVSPVVVTLAANGILQGLALLYSQGTPSGFAAPLLRSFMTDTRWGVPPVLAFAAVFIVAAVWLLERTPFGRALHALGHGERAAVFSALRVDRCKVAVYALSGFCAALAAVLLTGLAGQASLGMGDEYLLPSIAVVVIGGSAISGGRGHYLGMLGGVLLLTTLQTLLAGTALPHAARLLILGAVLLAAVAGLREQAN